MASRLLNLVNAPGHMDSAISRPRMLLFLLMLAMCINFFDRVSLSVAAPVLAPELHITTWSLGVLLSSFFWTYSVCQIGSGWLVDRVEARSAYAVARSKIR